MQVSDFINVELMSHPYNYVIVVLMLALWAFALCLIMAPLGSIGGITNVY